MATKFQVCPECDGEGFQGTLGAIFPSEEENGFFDDYLAVNRASQEKCTCCKGKRVVTADDLDEFYYAEEARNLQRQEAPYMY